MKFALKGVVKWASIILPIYMKQSSQRVTTMRVQRVAKMEHKQRESRGAHRKVLGCKICDSLSNTFASQRDNNFVYGGAQRLLNLNNLTVKVIRFSKRNPMERNGHFMHYLLQHKKLCILPKDYAIRVTLIE